MVRAAGDDTRLLDTREAFDSVAPEYSGALGNNAVIQRMRCHMWRAVERLFPPGARLLDLGCGTGIDAVHFATHGYQVRAVDWSPGMVAETRARARQAGLEHRVAAEVLGMQELDRLAGSGFDGIYSDLGTFNCAPGPTEVASACAGALRPGGRTVLSVIGRVCLWEIAYFLGRGKPRRALVRLSRGAVPVPLNGHTVWTRYYTPAEMARIFSPWFEVVSVRGLCVTAPPPYLLGLWERAPGLAARAAQIDDRIGTLPVVRSCGDHFLMVLERQAGHD